jgi:transcriptional regulator with XRE-family HTH domain
MGLPARLKKARLTAGYDRKTLTLKASLADGSVVLGLEQRRRVPRLDTVERLADALGLSPAFLAFGIDDAAGGIPTALRSEGVSTRLHTTRIAKDMTMRALSEKAGLSHPTARSTESGASMPTIATVEALANALGVSPGWLAYGLGPVELPNRRAFRSTSAQAEPSKADPSADRPL